MVTSQELAQARIQAERTRTQLAEQRRKTIESATSKKALLQQGGVAGRQSRATTIQKAGQISEQEKALSSYESQLKTAEQQLQQQQAQQSEYETAVKVYAGLIKRPSGFDENSQITKQAKEYVESSPLKTSISKEGALTQENALARITTTTIPATVLTGTTSPSSTLPTSGLNVPSGYATTEMLKIYSKYQSQLTPEQRKKLSQYEQNQIITSNLQYQKEISGELTKPTSSSSMQTYAKNMGYINPEKYGTYYSGIDMKKVEQITPLKLVETTQRTYTSPYINQLKKNKGKEVYNAKTNTYDRISSTGARETVISRPPTITEQIKIDETKAKGEKIYSILTSPQEYLPKNIPAAGFELFIPALKEQTEQKQKIAELGQNVLQETSLFFTESVLGNKETYKLGKDLSIESKQLEKDITSFSKKYPTGLTEESSIKEQENLNKRIEDYNKKLAEYNKREVAKERETYPLLYPVKGFVSAPLNVASNILGLWGNAPKEVLKTVGGTLSLPVAFYEKPVETMGTLIGQALFFKATGEVIKLPSKIKAKNAELLEKATQKQLELLESYKPKFVQAEYNQGSAFKIQATRATDALTQKFFGQGIFDQDISTGVSSSYIVGKIKYKDVFGITRTKGYGSFVVSEAGAKVIGKAVQKGNINALLFKTGGAVKSGEYPIVKSSTYFKVGEKPLVIQNLLRENIVQVVNERYISLTESLSQTGKTGLLTKIRTPESIGVVVKIPETETGINILRPAEITKTPLSKTFGEVLETKQIVIKPTPALPITKTELFTPTLKTNLKVPLIETNYPTYVGGTAITSSFISTTSLGGFEEFNVIKSLPKVKEPTLIYTPVVKVKERVLTFIQPQVKEQIQLKEFSISRLEPQTKIKQNEKQRFFERTLQQEKQLQKQALRQRQQQIEITTKKPFEFGLGLGTTKLPPTRKLTAREELIGMYEVFVKKKGKEESIGKTLELFKAGEKLKGSLLSGLQASGYVVKPTGERVKFEELATVLGTGFRAGKRDVTKIVQKRGFRLSTGIERISIQKARKASSILTGRRLKWL